MRAVVLGVLVAIAACGGGDDGPADVCVPETLYLNRTGATFTPGLRDDSVDNISPLIDIERELAAWSGPDSEWPQLAQCIRAGLAPFPIDIVEEDPGAIPHTELVFTDRYWEGPAGVTSVWQSDCREDLDVGFLFGNAFPTYARACYVAMRMYGQMKAQLSLTDDCMDFLNDGQDCSEERAFRDMTSTCVDQAGQPAPCRCGGETTQNSYQALLAATRCP